MNKIAKLFFVMILSLSFVSAQAGEMTVTGSAEATYTITSSSSTTAVNNTHPAIGLSNELDFNASGEFGNGLTWSYQVQLDPDTTDGSALNDDTSLVLGTPYGTIGIYNSEGDLNTHLAYSVAAYAPGHDIGTGGGYQGGVGMNSYNNISYTTPAGLLPFGTSFRAAYSNGDNIQSNDAANAGTTEGTDGIESYQLTTKPIDGLTVGASYLEKKGSGTALKPDYATGGGYAKYKIGNFAIGAGRHYVEFNQRSTATSPGSLTTKVFDTSTSHNTSTGVTTVTTTYIDGLKYLSSDSISVGYAANENLSLSYDKMTQTAHVSAQSATNVKSSTDRDLEVSTLQAAYNMGGAVIALSHKTIDNADFVNGKDLKEYMLGIKMAF